MIPPDLAATLTAHGFTPAPIRDFDPFDLLHEGPEVYGGRVELHTWTVPGHPPRHDLVLVTGTPLGTFTAKFSALESEVVATKLALLLQNLTRAHRVNGGRKEPA